MKSVNFQRNKSLIRVVNEEKIRKSRNWDRIIYLILLSLFLFFIVYYVVHKTLYINANGQVLLESLSIRMTEDVRIMDFRVAEGDSVKVNDTLFVYSSADKQNSSGRTNITIGNSGSDDDWWWKEVYNMKKKIAMNNIDINQNNMLLEMYQSEARRITNEVILDVLPKSRLDQLKTEIAKLVSENEKLQNENLQLQALMAQNAVPPPGENRTTEINTKSSGGNYVYGNNINAFSGEYLSAPRYFVSPIDGIITRVNLQQYETALKSEQIISLHKNYNLTIKAFFEQDNLDQLHQGDVFKIEFPDGTTSLGVLKRFYFATYAMPEEFQKKYEPTTRTISADIYPLNDDEAKKWKAFYKMGVEITKFKY